MQKLDYSCGEAVLATVIRYYWGDNVNEETILRLLPKLKLTDADSRTASRTDSRSPICRSSNKAGYEAAMGKVTFDQLAESKVPVVVGITVPSANTSSSSAAPTAVGLSGRPDSRQHPHAGSRVHQGMAEEHDPRDRQAQATR